MKLIHIVSYLDNKVGAYVCTSSWNNAGALTKLEDFSALKADWTSTSGTKNKKADEKNVPLRTII